MKHTSFDTLMFLQKGPITFPDEEFNYLDLMKEFLKLNPHLFAPGTAVIHLTLNRGGLIIEGEVYE